ncbi:hypothetical protein [Jiangella gansuensis]|uniref:hypothetical protein n=1 Tax=Jiangella gansuensis TaxID=281473 RepID=UPI0004AE1BDC|nr:hypothetical protein [Jiangella gansuensis]
MTERDTGGHEPDPQRQDPEVPHDQDSEPSKNAPDEGRPDLTALSDDDDEN